MDICQINPLVASASAVSSAMVKAGFAIQRTLRGSLGPSKPCPLWQEGNKKLSSDACRLPSTSLDISVVIVGWNAEYYLNLCLESLAKAPPRRSMEVLVVDNASTDGSVKMIEAKFPWVKLIKSSENLGFAKGNNASHPAKPEDTTSRSSIRT